MPKDGFKITDFGRSEEHTSELQSQSNLVCRLLLEKKKLEECEDLEEHLEGGGAVRLMEEAATNEAMLDRVRHLDLTPEPGQRLLVSLFFFTDTAPTEIYTLSLHDALPISPARLASSRRSPTRWPPRPARRSWNTPARSEEHTSELQSQSNLVCRLLLEKKKKQKQNNENIKKYKKKSTK